jgi:hypothetical protein
MKIVLLLMLALCGCDTAQEAMRLQKFTENCNKVANLFRLKEVEVKFDKDSAFSGKYVCRAGNGDNYKIRIDEEYMDIFLGAIETYLERSKL